METINNIMELEENAVRVLESMRKIDKHNLFVKKICEHNNQSQLPTNIVTPVPIRPLPSIGYYCKGNLLPKSLESIPGSGYFKKTIPCVLMYTPLNKKDDKCISKNENINIKNLYQHPPFSKMLDKINSPLPEKNNKCEIPLSKNITKERRTVIKGETLNILMLFYSKNKYPSKAEFIRLSKITNLPIKKIRIWFQNRRASQARELREIGLI